MFQATGKRIPPIILSLLRKGIIDIPLMILFNSIWGVDGIAVAIPVSDFIAAASELNHHSQHDKKRRGSH